MLDLAARKPEEAYLAWIDTIRALSRQPRWQFLQDFPAFIPFMLTLVAPECRAELAVGVLDTIEKIKGWQY
jgi:hypothetical protein